jgi:RNase P subunit RPR2
MKVAVKCECGKRIADRDEQYIYIYCKKCKKTHRYKLSEPAPKKGQSRESHDP